METTNICNVPDNFNFVLPLDIVKSGAEDERRIGGYASTEDTDVQGDEIVQKGLDISYFVNHGWFNFDHQGDVILGYPDKSKCRIDNKGLYVEGTLLKGVEVADRLWETAIALKRSKAPRKLGFSVEGKVIERDASQKITKAAIYNVAITAKPVNPSCTFEALVKSLTNTAEIEVVDKAVSTQSAQPIIPESLEQCVKTLSEVAEDKEKQEILKKELEEKQTLTKSEYILYLQIAKGLSFDDASNLVNTTIKEV